MFTLIKKIGKIALMIGIALIICGVVSGFTLAEFEKNEVKTDAYITTIEEGGFFDNGGYVVHVRYNTLENKRITGTISSGNLGQHFIDLQAEADKAGMDVIDYADSAQSTSKVIPIYYNKEIPDSFKYVDYKESGNDFYKWGGIIGGGALAVLLVNYLLKKKKEERAAEKRVEKKQAKQAQKQGR
ncbi:MAG: hypothetical protein E7554_06820 [Ruminococcaceae bacterium]|nr:hypothetical protein [Oscillospiraceae bacterium]